MTIAHNRQEWRVLSAAASIHVLPQQLVPVKGRLTDMLLHDTKHLLGALVHYFNKEQLLQIMFMFGNTGQKDETTNSKPI